MRVQLRDLTPGTEYAIQFRSNNGDEVSEWSQVQRFTTTNDTIAPAPVTNLAWAQSGSSFVATWDKPTTDARGNPLFDFRDFQLEIDDTVNAFKHIVHTVDPFFALTEDEHVKVFGGRKTSLRLTVKVRDLNYNESAPVTLTAAADTPPVPDKPTTSNYLGMLMVTWNGKAAGGAAMPENFSHCEVHVGTSANFTPDDSTYKTRVVAIGSASSAVIPGLAFGTQVWVRLVGVSKLGRRSGPSASTSGTPDRVSGLEIKDGSLSAEQINWTSTAIPGQNAYYSTSQPTVAIGGGAFKVNDLWYDTDNSYEVYKWDGTAWVPAPEVGFIPASKLIAGTITGDRIAANFFQAAHAHIGSAFIDAAMINTVSAASITTGDLQANQIIYAGPRLGNHAEMTSQGFFVRGPQPGVETPQPSDIIDRIRMGTGISDFFAIPDPVDPESTLAQIDENGTASFQDLYVVKDPTIQGKKLSAIVNEQGRIVGEGQVSPINGLNAAGAQGIRGGEYGIGQFSFEAVAGRTYQIWSQLSYWYITNGGEPHIYLRLQKDLRTSAEKASNIAPTPATKTSTLIVNQYLNTKVGGWAQNDPVTAFWRSDFTGTVTIGFSMDLWAAPAADSVLKINDSSTLIMKAIDMGPSRDLTGRSHNMGGTLYSWTAPPPPPPPTKTQYYGEWRYNWIRSYQGNGAYMTNTNGRAYQGTDPSGFNGNQIGYFGFAGLDFTTLGPQIDRVVLYLYFAHWYYNAGGTARIGYTNQWSDPGGAARPGGIWGTFDSGGWPKPGGRELDITGWAGAFANGTARGIALGPGNNGYQNYGYATDCVLKFWYTK